MLPLAAVPTVQQLLSDVVGQTTGRSTVVVERGPVTGFAAAVLDDDPAYRTPEAAAAAGLADIPAPPTFPLVMETWGKFDDLQPADAPPANAPSANPLAKALGPLFAGGGLILHGEQEFAYHRPVVVGDVLDGVGTVVDAYQKESKGHTMTFVVTRTDWTDRHTGDPVVSSTLTVIHRA